MLPILGRCNKWHMPWQLTGRKTIKDTCMNKNNLMALHEQKCKNTWHLVLISQCGHIPHATPTLRAPASRSVQTNPNVKIGYLTRFKSLINIRRARVGDQSLINIPDPQWWRPARPTTSAAAGSRSGGGPRGQRQRRPAANALQR